MDDQAVCTQCGDVFAVPSTLRDRYPGWTPSRCRSCHDKQQDGSTPKQSRKQSGARSSGGSRPRVEENLTTEQVLAKYHDGPQSGVFTDGSADPNPGPGGWGAVYVVDGEIIDEAWGHDPDTTNNRMELMALMRGIELVPSETVATVYSDSRLVVDTVTKWAQGWARNGWRRKTGPVQNLDLVQPLFERVRQRPELDIQWIKAHAGSRWNEYADALATAYRRQRT